MNNYAPNYMGQLILKPKGKKKKKAPKNSFSFFLDDMCEELKAKGFTINSKSDGVSYANVKWKGLPDHIKRKYEEKAKQWKLSNKKEPGKMDCRGEQIASHVDPADIQERNMNEQRKYLQTWFEPGKDVCDQDVYIISFQSMYELPNENGYLPCEMACVKFSIRDGIKGTLHHFVDPGKIDLGFRGDCKTWSDKTHRIPENFEKIEVENNKIWQDLLDFVGYTDNSNTDLVLFSKMYEMRANKFCLQWLARNTGNGQKNPFRLFYLEECIAEIFANATKGSKPPLSVIEKGCESTYHDSDMNTRCEYHEEIECNYCSLLITQRCCFYMGMNLCKLYNIEVQRGKHLPNKRPQCFTIEPSIDSEDFRLPMKNLKISGNKGSKRNDSFSYGAASQNSEQEFPFSSRDIRSKQSDYSESLASNDSYKNNRFGGSRPQQNAWAFSHSATFQDDSEMSDFNSTFNDSKLRNVESDDLNRSTRIPKRQPAGFPRAVEGHSYGSGEPQHRPVSFGRGRFLKKNAKPSFSSLFK